MDSHLLWSANEIRIAATGGARARYKLKRDKTLGMIKQSTGFNFSSEKENPLLS